MGIWKSTLFYVQGTLTMLISVFWLCTGILHPSSLGWVINMEPDWMGALRLLKVVFNSVLYPTTPYCSPLEKHSTRSSYYYSFLYKDDILNAPEKQFVSGKLQMEHLLTKYIWEVCNGSHIGNTFCLAVSLGVMKWENVSFTET